MSDGCQSDRCLRHTRDVFLLLTGDDRYVTTGLHRTAFRRHFAFFLELGPRTRLALFVVLGDSFFLFKRLLTFALLILAPLDLRQVLVVCPSQLFHFLLVDLRAFAASKALHQRCVWLFHSRCLVVLSAGGDSVIGRLMLGHGRG